MAEPASAKDVEIGRQLIERGCRQGSLVKGVPARTPVLKKAADWAHSESVHDGAAFVVASQDCDVDARTKDEQCVEVMVARWTGKKSEIDTARKGNSWRLFLLQEGDGQALVADARLRTWVEKTSLAEAQSFETVLDPGRARRFARWVAGRYDRPALDDRVVIALQRPIVESVLDARKKNQELWRLLDGLVDEIRFAVPQGDPPWPRLDFIFLLEDGAQLAGDGRRELLGWLQAVVVGARATAECHAAVETPSSISLRHYLDTERLPLDYLSAAD